MHTRRFSFSALITNGFKDRRRLAEIARRLGLADLPSLVTPLARCLDVVRVGVAHEGWSRSSVNERTAFPSGRCW